VGSPRFETKCNEALALARQAAAYYIQKEPSVQVELKGAEMSELTLQRGLAPPPLPVVTGSAKLSHDQGGGDREFGFKEEVSQRMAEDTLARRRGDGSAWRGGDSPTPAASAAIPATHGDAGAEGEPGERGERVDDEIVGDGAAAQREVHGAAQEYEAAHSAFPVEQAGREKESEERRAGAETGTRHGLIMAGPEKESEERRAGAEAGELDGLIWAAMARVWGRSLRLARRAAKQKKWRTASELLMPPVAKVAPGAVLSSEVHQVVGGFQCLVAWSGEVIIAGGVTASAEEAEQDAYRMTYDHYMPSAVEIQGRLELDNPSPTERR
jgi:hypothetical protein